MSTLIELVLIGSMINGINRSRERVSNLGKEINSQMTNLRGADRTSLAVHNNNLFTEAAKLVSTVKSIIRLPEMKPISKKMDNINSYLILANKTEEAIRYGNMSELKKLEKEILSTSQALNSNLLDLHYQESLLEQKQTSIVIGGALKEIGYPVLETRSYEKKGITYMRANDKDVTVVMKLDNQGGLTLDAKGLSGQKCHKEIERIKLKLEEKGFKFEVRKIINHGREDGGELVKETKDVFNPLIERRKREERMKRANYTRQQKRQ